MLTEIVWVVGAAFVSERGGYFNAKTRGKNELKATKGGTFLVCVSRVFPAKTSLLS
jgi:hypothetical protein